MGEIRVTDDLLKEILPKVSDELIKEWENSVTKEHKFSKQFNRNMNKFIWKQKNQQLLKELMVIGKIAAAIFLMIGISLFGNKMVAKAGLDALFKKIEVVLEDSYMYFYDENTGLHCYTMYEPDYIPEGYVEIFRLEEDDYLKIMYSNKDGDVIQWSQMFVKSGMVYGADGEYDDIVRKQYNGNNVTIYVYESGLKSVYYEEGSSIFSIQADSLSVKEVYKIIENMKEIEKK